jgi:hypothetical protein
MELMKWRKMHLKNYWTNPLPQSLGSSRVRVIKRRPAAM